MERVLARVTHAILAAPSGLTTLPVLRGPARGIKLAIDLNKGGETAYVLGRHEPRSIATMAALVEPGWRVWDCGCHIGYFTMLLAQRVGPRGKVIAFEPNPRLLERVRLNGRINGFTNIEYCDAAIAGDEPEVELVLVQGTESHITGMFVGAAPKPEESTEHMRVPAQSLDQALDRFGPPNFLKMDIEGAENIALRHCDRLLSEARPIIAIELHNPQGQQLVRELAGRYGYSLRDGVTDNAASADREVPTFSLLMP